MHRLSREEREIRESRGISLQRVVPFALSFLALMIMSYDTRLYVQCIGRAPNASADFRAGWARLIVATFCSPYYVRDFADHWFVIGLFVVGVVFSIRQLLWFKRHKAYWDVIREKERVKRAEKAAVKKAAQMESQGEDGPE